MKKFIVFILSLSLFMSMPVSVYADKKSKPVAKSSILMCMDNKEILAEENAYEHLSPASVTKIMSILLIMDSIDSGKIKLDDMVAASENAVSKGGSQIWLEVGEKMSVDDLLKAVVIASANDACTLLAEYVAGSDTSFVSMMNSKVKELGLKDSHFENCTGLDDDTTNHYSCAYDLAVIATEVMKYDLIKKYSTVWQDYLRDGKTELNNTNKLVNKYNGITGLKTGTTSNAGFCLCATATREGMSLVSVVLGGETSEDRFNKSVELLDYGFSNYKLINLEVDEKKITDVKVKNGVIKTIKPSIATKPQLVVNKEQSELEYDYQIRKVIKAPVIKGQKLGKIVVRDSDGKLGEIELTARENIDEVNFLYIFKYLLKNI